jgi:hypothetical protein
MCCCGLLGGCLGGCCVGCCSALQECRVKHGVASRIPYIFIVFIFSIFAVFMSLYGEEVFYRNHLFHTKLSVCNSASCKGNGSVYRTSFALFVFFLIHVILVYFMNSFHWLFFGCKLFFLIGFLTATFWMPNAFFDGYADFARIASVVFLLLQIIVLISWAWDVNDYVVAKINAAQEEKPSADDDDSGKNIKKKEKLYKCLLVLATSILFGAIIILFIFMFHWFDKNSSCSFNEVIISITVVLVGLAIVLPPILRSGSIFTAGVVGFYMTYLCYSGLTSYPNTRCNPFAAQRNTASLWVGIVITAAAISYVGFGTSKHNVLFPDDYEDSDNNKAERDDIELQAPKNKKQKANEEEKEKINKKEDENDNDNDDDINDCNGNDNERERSVSSAESGEKPQLTKSKIEQRSNVLFHLCMAFAAIYMCMLYTNWGTNVISKRRASSTGKVSFWVNMGAEWATFVLYVWTLLAPKLCPQRFGVANE